MKIEIEKPFIPQFVADWLEKERTSSPIHKSFPRAVDLVNRDEDWGNWANEVGSRWSRILATAWVRGYRVEEPLYYAKIKGWEILGGGFKWVYLENSKGLIIGDVTFPDDETEAMTKEEWKKLGINETNADFEVVSE